jgi:predicted transport protein
MSSNSPNDMTAAVSDNIQKNTGKTLEEWVAAVLESGLDPLDQNSVRKWLKSEHNIPQNTQWAIADAAARAVGWVRPSPDGYIDSQYQGKKAILRPIFDSIRAAIMRIDPLVSVEGRGGYTPFVHKRQFTAVKASSKMVVLGLRYREAPSSDRLLEGKATGQCTHRVELTSPEQVDEEVIRLLTIAHEQN